jgi:PAS domain S-box-containing protein/putative nucleotidyltransferase with HDIG domain
MVKALIKTGNMKNSQYSVSETIEKNKFSNMTEILQDLNRINDADSICLFVCDKVKEIIGRGYVSVTLMDTDQTTIVLKSMKGFEDKGLINSAIRLIGSDPRGMKFSIKDMTANELASFQGGRLELQPEGLYALFTRKFPKAICNALEQLLKINFVYTIGFIHHSHHLGGITILLDSKTAIEKNAGIIENIVNQSAIYLSRIHIEKQLRKSLFYNRELIETSLDLLATINQDGKIIDTNKAAEKVTGLPLSKLIGSDFSDYFLERDKAIEGYRKVLSEGFIRNYPLTMKHLSGENIDLLFNATIYNDEKGEIQGIFASAHDITERKKVEEALRESETSLRIAQRLAKIGDWKWTIITDTTQWSDELYQINGHDPKLPVPSFAEMSSFYTPESWQRLNEAVAKALNNGEPYELELDLVRTDNTIIKTFTRGEVHYDESGKIKWLNGTVQDITEIKKAEEALKISYEKTKKILEETIETLASIVEIRDPYTSGHQKEVTQISTLIAKEMSLDEDILSAISTAAIIHDIGKIYIPASILSKPGKLSDIEYEMIKTHSQTGYDMIKNIDFPWPIADIVLQHHEKINGSGYPKGLKGDAIMLEARIIAVADVVEAMASHRPYRPSLGIGQALEEIKENKGILYDSKVVDACSELIKNGVIDFYKNS